MLGQPQNGYWGSGPDLKAWLAFCFFIQTILFKQCVSMDYLKPPKYEWSCSQLYEPVYCRLWYLISGFWHLAYRVALRIPSWRFVP